MHTCSSFDNNEVLSLCKLPYFANVIVDTFPLPIMFTPRNEMKYDSPYLAPFRIASLVVVLNASSLPLPLTL